MTVNSIFNMNELSIPTSPHLLLIIKFVKEGKQLVGWTHYGEMKLCLCRLKTG